MIKVLMIEDSTATAELLKYILVSDPEIKVVGRAFNGAEGVKMVESLKPDVVTMDIEMPVMDGFEATKSIMSNFPVPIIIVTASFDKKDVEKSFKAMACGACYIMEKPVSIMHPNYASARRELISTVKSMSELKLVKRRFSDTPKPGLVDISPSISVPKRDVRIVAIGASTGGPPALQTVLSGLPKDLSVPVLITQHISSGFVGGFAEWLAQASGQKVHVAKNEYPQPGHFYVAPDNYHMVLGPGGSILLSSEGPRSNLRPSVSALFESVAKVYKEKSIGVLLTGMGKDGAKDLKLMRDNGAATIAQDKETSMIYGMPGEAAALGAATYILPDYKIAKTITELIG